MEIILVIALAILLFFGVGHFIWIAAYMVGDMYKHTYKITWNYGSTYTDTYTEIVSASTIDKAWKKLRKEHGIFINLIKWEELER